MHSYGLRDNFDFVTSMTRSCIADAVQKGGAAPLPGIPAQPPVPKANPYSIAAAAAGGASSLPWSIRTIGAPRHLDRRKR